VWLVYAKAHTGKRLPYADAVEEALCFGWIDTIVRRLDEDYYMQKFTPRRNTRNWSKINLERFARMEAAGLMTDAGRAVRPGDLRPPPRRLQVGDPVPRFVAAALAKHPAARDTFRALAPSYRRDYLRSTIEAKKPETRERRLVEAIRLLESGRKRLFDPGNPR
jgi:uncharacterized protein YdeI (YjbR/CyaY-like superfamily)